MEHVSIILCHYAQIDDFGASAAGKNPPKRIDLLKECLDSMKQYTDFPAEVIVMDNGGSPDDTEYLLSRVRDGTINTLVRYKENRNFAYAWNEGARIATGNYLSFVCNDIKFGPKWLSSCIQILKDYPDKQYVATPFITYDKRKHTVEITKEGYRVNMRSGSNCMVMRREDWPKLGEFPNHRIGGSIWYTKNFREGWWFVAPPEDLAGDMGWRHGTNFHIPIEVKKVLLTGEEIHYEEKQ
jgi:GT2 family glycosyltransferase